jgi:hypothetical protein
MSSDGLLIVAANFFLEMKAWSCGSGNRQLFEKLAVLGDVKTVPDKLR